MFQINDDAKIIQHNNIKYVSQDGIDFYFNTKLNKTAMSLRGIARLLDCNPKTIVKKGDTFDKVKHSVMPTGQGIQGVTFIVEDDLNDFFNLILDSRIKQETKDKVRQVQSKFVQAGFRLLTLLNVAPEVVAREAINRIDNPEQAERIAVEADLQAQYLRSHVAINYEAKKNELKAGKIVGENNLSVGLPYKGGRHKADGMQKSILTTTQLGQTKVLNSIRKSDNKYSEETKYKKCDKVRKAMAAYRDALDAMLEDI